MKQQVQSHARLYTPAELPELLAPAGSPEALQAAISAGADAVYFGGAAFSNRMRARNFEKDELTEALRLTSRWGVRSYITINTRVRDDELEEVLALAEFLLEGGCTGFIIADMGIAAQLHSRFPEAMLHASTQMTLANSADGRMMADQGFTRMVVPREISLPELRQLTADSPLEIEMFLHGAYCVSVSGQCLMSWAMGGRSGNRGECAQPCRMVYRVGRENPAKGPLPRQDSRNPADYPLSLKDMCLAAHIPALIDAGVASLKIEGRQKPAAYVYGVTGVYRKLLDEKRAATPDEIVYLDSLFSRNGFTDGYFRAGQGKSPYGTMGGIRPTTEEQQKHMPESKAEPVGKYDFSHRARPCTIHMTLSPEQAFLTMTDCTTGTAVTVQGELPAKATGAPVTTEALVKNLRKLGGTAFTLREEPSVSLADGLWYPLSAINALRRTAAEKLDQALHPAVPIVRGEPCKPTPHPQPAEKGRDSLQTAVLYHRKQWIDRMAGLFDTVYLPADEYLKWAGEEKLPDCAAAILPPLVFDETRLHSTIDALSRAGCSRVMFHSPGQLHLLRQANLTADGSFRLNLWNTAAVSWWYDKGADRLTVSPEMALFTLRNLAENSLPCGAIVYGYLPLMLTERCVLHTVSQGSAKNSALRCGGYGGRKPSDPHVCGGCRGHLTDRLGNHFPVISKNGESTICNSLPIWMGDKMDILPPLTHREYHFTIETPEEIERILDDHQNGIKRHGRRLK